MGFKRYLKKQLIPGYGVMDSIQKMKDYGVLGGLKEYYRELYLEDTPIICNIYDLGKNEGWDTGKKDGYAQASYKYEQKIIKQTEEFINQKVHLSNNIKEKERLLDEYEKYICEMETKYDSLSKEQLILLNKMRAMQKKLILYKDLDTLLEENDKEMLIIIKKQLSNLLVEYLLTEEEVSILIEVLNGKLSGTTLKDMNESQSNVNYANELILKIIEPLVEKRKQINNTKEKSHCSNNHLSSELLTHDSDTVDKRNHDKYENKEIPAVLPKYDDRGFIKNTSRHRNGTKYDDEGFDKYGNDINGFKIDGYSRVKSNSTF